MNTNQRLGRNADGSTNPGFRYEPARLRRQVTWTEVIGRILVSLALVPGQAVPVPARIVRRHPTPTA